MNSDSSLLAARLGEVRRVVVGSPSLVRRVGAPTHPNQLATLPTVHFRGGSLPAAWSFLDQGRPLKVSVNARLTTNLSLVGIDACESGLGFGRFLSYQVEAPLARRRLRVVLSKFEPAPTPVHLVFAHSRLLSARTRALIEWLKRRLSRSLVRDAPDAGRPSRSIAGAGRARRARETSASRAAAGPGCPTGATSETRREIAPVPRPPPRAAHRAR
jgi:DNA-binding transcriptional LysR family regulator